MSNLRLFEPALSDPFETMFKRFMAPLRDGVLTLELPKKAMTASKRITIQ